MRWLYPERGETAWEWTTGSSEQAVLFYESEQPASQDGPPPMSDNDWQKLEEHLNPGKKTYDGTRSR